MKLQPQPRLETLKSYWMRVSFRDGIKFGMGFIIGVSIAGFLMSLFWFIVKMTLGIAFIGMTSNVSIPM